LLLAAFVLLVRVGTADGRGSAAEAVVVILVTAAFVHGLIGFAYYLPTYKLGISSVLPFAGAGVAGSVLGRRLFLEGISRLGAASADSLKASTPAFSFAWATLWLKEATAWHNAVGVASVCVGLLLLSRSTSAARGAGRAESRASVLFPLLAAVCYSLEPVLVRVGLAKGTPVLLGLGIQSVFAASIYLACSAAVGRSRWSAFKSRALPWYLAAGGASAGFLLLYNVALSVSSVVKVFPLTQISPLLVIGLSWLLLRPVERIRPQLVFGAALTVGGAIAVSL
jgi:DME family drug/metabolite transporter